VSEGVSPQFTYQQRLTYEVELLRALHRLFLSLLKLNSHVGVGKAGLAYVGAVNTVRAFYAMLTSELREEVSARLGSDVLEATEYIPLAAEDSESPLPVRREDLEQARGEVLKEIRGECEESCKEACLEGCAGRKKEFKRACESEAFEKRIYSYSPQHGEFMEKCVEEKLEDCAKQCEVERLSECIEDCVSEESGSREFEDRVRLHAFVLSSAYWEKYCYDFLKAVVDVLKEHGLLLRESEVFRGVVGGEESQ